jgi:hypothetical protein
MVEVVVVGDVVKVKKFPPQKRWKKSEYTFRD